MSKLGSAGWFAVGKGQVEVKLSLLKFKEDGIVFIYSPSLDLSGYGRDGRAAKGSFEVSMEEFVNYTVHKRTLEKELERLGLKIGDSKRAPRFEQPYLDKLFKARPYLAEIFREKEFQRYDEEVAFPAV